MFCTLLLAVTNILQIHYLFCRCNSATVFSAWEQIKWQSFWMKMYQPVMTSGPACCENVLQDYVLPFSCNWSLIISYGPDCVFQYQSLINKREIWGECVIILTAKEERMGLCYKFWVQTSMCCAQIGQDLIAHIQYLSLPDCTASVLWQVGERWLTDQLVRNCSLQHNYGTLSFPVVLWCFPGTSLLTVLCLRVLSDKAEVLVYDSYANLPRWSS